MWSLFDYGGFCGHRLIGRSRCCRNPSCSACFHREQKLLLSLLFGQIHRAASPSPRWEFVTSTALAATLSSTNVCLHNVRSLSSSLHSLEWLLSLSVIFPVCSGFMVHSDLTEERDTGWEQCNNWNIICATDEHSGMIISSVEMNRFLIAFIVCLYLGNTLAKGR